MVALILNGFIYGSWTANSTRPYYSIFHIFSLNLYTFIITLSAPAFLKCHIRGLFGGDFNLVVWWIFIGLPNLNHAVLTRTHEMNWFTYLPFCQIKMTSTLFLNKLPNIRLSNKSTYTITYNYSYNKCKYCFGFVLQL